MKWIGTSWDHVRRKSSAATAFGCVSSRRSRYNVYAWSILWRHSGRSSPLLRISPATLRAVYAPRLKPKK